MIRLQAIEHSTEGAESMESSRKKQYTNQLVHETSPYLLQHAHNPVNWYPWSEKALQKAREENKMIVVSIGYSACHWCHVMERESFENEVIAKAMNDNYISIKVDREERPDIDRIYMTAVQLMTGSGGWPLNCIALPDGSPVFGGTYFTPDKWLEIVQGIATLYAREPGKVLDYARNLKQGIITAELFQEKQEHLPLLKEDLESYISSWKKRFDIENGGTKGFPKFPLPVTLQSLLSCYYHSHDQELYDYVMLTLDKIAAGGIHDHIGGGFARYSTDIYWKIPHFEKMLYDNSQLVSIYSKAFQVSKKEEYKTIVYNTLDFVERELTAQEGGFYSSLDADSEGTEGKYYVWDHQEIQNLLGKDAALFSSFYTILPEGNWEGTNVLHRTRDIESFLKKNRMKREDLMRLLEKNLKVLLKSRNERIRPALDDKILTSWNALMQKGYIDAYRVFGDNRFLESAERNAHFIRNNLLSEDFRLDRNYKNRKSSINGFLDDYANLIEAWIALYEATFNEQWLNLASSLMKYTIAHFYDERSGMFFYTSDLDPLLVTRKMELDDTVIPSSVSTLAHGLYNLGKLLDSKEYISISEQMVINMKSSIGQNPGFYSNWIRLIIRFIYNPCELAITGPESKQLRQLLDEHYLPDIVLAGGNSDSGIPLLRNRFKKGKTLIYVCRDQVCKMPVDTVSEAVKMME